MSAAAKKDAVARAIDTINKGLGGVVARRLSDGGTRSDVKSVVPAGIGPLDHYVLGVGGFPAGCITEMSSEEGLGKTSLALAGCAKAQEEGGIAIYAETEFTLQAARVEAFGVDPDQLILIQPERPNIEGIMNAIGDSVAALPMKGPPHIIVWDSLAGTPSAREASEGLVGKSAFDSRAKSISRAMRVLPALAVQHQTAVVIINQIREKIGVMFGDSRTTPGGHAIKHAAMIRLYLYPGKAIKDGVVHVGKYITVQAVKNKLVPPWRKCRIKFMYDEGWDDEWSTLEFAKDCGFAPPKAHGAKAYDEALKLLTASNWGAGSVLARMHEAGDTRTGADSEETDEATEV